jgi:hypothetical protein
MDIGLKTAPDVLCYDQAKGCKLFKKKCFYYYSFISGSEVTLLLWTL